MKSTTTRPEPGALLLLCGWLAAEALLQLLAAAVALLLTAAGWRPRKSGLLAVIHEPRSCHPSAGDPEPLDQGMPVALLEASTVAQLRCLARAAGHRQLARSGRRADLLLALGAV